MSIQIILPLVIHPCIRTGCYFCFSNFRKFLLNGWKNSKYRDERSNYNMQYVHKEITAQLQ